MSNKKSQPLTGFTFEIFGEEWRVEIRDEPIVEPELGRVSGFCDSDLRSIVLERNTKDFLRKVLFHEITHAALSMASTSGIKGKDGWIPEEVAAEMMGTAMKQLIEQSAMLPTWVFCTGWKK